MVQQLVAGLGEMQAVGVAHQVLSALRSFHFLLDEIDGFQNVLGVLIHRASVYHAVCNAHVEYKVRTVHMMGPDFPGS